MLGTFALAIAVNAICHKKVNCDKNEPGNPESQIDGEINIGPVGSDFCELPGAREVEYDGSDNKQE